jgi:hypothetical protein
MAARTVEVPIANLRRTLDAGREIIDVVKVLTDLADHASDPGEARATVGRPEECSTVHRPLPK